MPVKKDVQFYLTELQTAARHEKRFRERARKVVQLYRDEKREQDSPSTFNILWANTQTQLPALYSSTPKPVVRRRHRQQGEAGRLISQALERALVYSLDPGGSYDFDRVAEKLMLDYLLPGRMVARVKYHPVLSEQIEVTVSDERPDDPELDVEINDEGKFVFETKYDELVDEEVIVQHIPWDQYRQSVANSWNDVWWVAYGNNFLTQDEIIEQFGEEHSDVPMTHIAHAEDKDGDPKTNEERTVRRAQVWEIWDREDRKVYAVIEGYDRFLMEIDDPLKLRSFFPQPEPELIVETPDTLIPIPEYTLYQCQADELNQITRRIDNLVKAMKIAGVYPGSEKGLIKQLFDSPENTLVPVEDWISIRDKGGLQGIIEWIPLKDVADAWQRLLVQRNQLIQAIFELTGISDIQRGATDPRETKGAQQLKASFASRRLLPKQQGTQRFFRDLFRLQAELIAEHFEPDTIQRMAQMDEVDPQAFDQAIQIMRDDALRSFTIDIETDSTIAPDEIADKQGVAEFTSAMSTFLQQAFPIIQAQPAAMGPLGRMLLWMTRKFKIARDAEDEIEDFLQVFNNLPQQEDQAAKAKAQEAQAKMQLQQQEKQAAIQIKQAESQAEIARKDRESQAEQRRQDERLAMEREKHRAEMAERQAKIRLMREEAEAKFILSAVEAEMKRESESAKTTEAKSGNGSTDVNVDVSQEKRPRRIKLIKDEKGEITGAEITPMDETKKVTFERDDEDRISGANIN